MPTENAADQLEQAKKEFEAKNGSLGLESDAPLDDEMRARRRKYMEEVLGFTFTSEAEEEEKHYEGTAYADLG